MRKKSLHYSLGTELPVSCGTLVINAVREILLCHVTGHDLWDLPKGMQEQGETAVKAARRELHEETGLEFAEDLFVEIGCFDFRPDKKLHLFKIQTEKGSVNPETLICVSHFIHVASGKSLPEMDGFRWAKRVDVPNLCGPNLQRVLLALEW